MGFLARLKRIFSSDVPTQTEEKDDILKEEIVEEKKEIKPTILYTATKEVEEIIENWMQTNKISEETFGQILFKLGKFSELKNYEFQVTDNPIDFSCANEGFIGEISCTRSLYHSEGSVHKKYLYIFPETSKLNEIRLSLYKNKLIFSESSVEEFHPVFEDEYINAICGIYTIHSNEYSININKDSSINLIKLDNLFEKYYDTVTFFESENFDEDVVVEKVRTKECNAKFNENGCLLNMTSNNKALTINFTNNNALKEIINGDIEYLLSVARYVAEDIIDNLPITDWSNEKIYNRDLFSIYFYCYDPWTDELRHKDYKIGDEYSYLMGIDWYNNGYLYIKSDDIDRFTDKFSIIDILSNLYHTNQIGLSNKIFEKYENYYKYINITTMKDNKKCLELVCQLDDETKDRRLTILDKDSNIIRDCTIKNEYLESANMKRVIEIVQEDYKIKFEATGYEINTLNDETFLLLRLFELFPIKANIDWVFEAILGVLHRKPTDNYERLNLSFYENDKLLVERNWNNLEFKPKETSNVLVRKL